MAEVVVSVHLHYGGNWVMNPNLEYVGGDIKVFPAFDIGYLNYFDIRDSYKVDLGFPTIKNIYVHLPGRRAIGFRQKKATKSNKETTSRAIGFIGDGSNVTFATDLLVNARGLQWMGQRSVSFNQLQNEREQRIGRQKKKAKSASLASTISEA